MLESVVTNVKRQTRVIKSVQRIVSPDRIEEDLLANRGLTVRVSYNYQTTPDGTRILVAKGRSYRNDKLLTQTNYHFSVRYSPIGRKLGYLECLEQQPITECSLTQESEEDSAKPGDGG